MSSFPQYQDDSGDSTDRRPEPPRSPPPTRPNPPRPASHARQEQANGRWLTIDAACKLLGVDQSTLRRWSDSGKVPVFRTPGGHRRYSEDDLRAFMSGESSPRRRMSRQLLTNLSMAGYERDYLETASRHRWYDAYDARSIAELRLLGRRMVDLTIRFLSSRGDRDVIIAESHEIGRQYGCHSARAGLSTVDALEAFLFFRRPVVQAVTHFIEEEHTATQRAERVLNELSAYMDDVLLAMAAAHQEHSAN
jgi:excisionase family DNA binding protein